MVVMQLLQSSDESQKFMKNQFGEFAVIGQCD
jgi:hypothetical protein